MEYLNINLTLPAFTNRSLYNFEGRAYQNTWAPDLGVSFTYLCGQNLHDFYLFSKSYVQSSDTFEIEGIMDYTYLDLNASSYNLYEMIKFFNKEVISIKDIIYDYKSQFLKTHIYWLICSLFIT